MTKIRPTLLVLAFAAAACHPAPKPATAPAPLPTAARPAGAPTTTGDSTAGARPGGGAPGAGGANAEPNPRPYGRVITPEAKSKSGLFKVHRIASKLYFEIPRNELGRDMLLTTEIAKTTAGAGYGGQSLGEDVIRWERRDNRILLRLQNYSIVSSDTTNPITTAVNNANYAPIVKAFNVESWGPDSSAVIDVTSLFVSPPVEMSPTAAYRGTIDASRSFLANVAAYPENIKVTADLTVNTPPAAGGAAPGGRGLPPSATLQMAWSIVQLPVVPMMPRLFDSRVGYFSNRTTDFGRAVQKSESRTFITRYRLECSDQKVGNLCVPKKPIVYYVDPATPSWLVPWVVKAIESWQPAFEAAGFSKGIIAKMAPTRAEDPDWSVEDARYSVIDWLPSTTENAVGPHTADPRSGEIISAHLQIYHNVMNLNRDWYWTQAGAIDPRARKLPFPDSLAGRLMQYVIAHEIGHSIGFQHNMKASAMYPADSIRNRDFVHRMGHTPTLMDYSRFNYVAQPEDNIALEDLIPRIGPYDIWATKWGYMPIPGARTPDDERATLDAMAREQDTKPWLRFSTSDAGSSDPRNNTEAVGDDDAVKSTGQGLKNIKRLVPMLIPASTGTVTDDYADLEELFGRLVGQWATELRHVAVIPGSRETQEKYISQSGVRYTAVPMQHQRDAVRFLNENAFQTPTFFLRPEILDRIQPDGAITRINGSQAGILSTLLSDARLSRMIEMEALSGGTEVYTAPAMLADVRQGVWSELSAGAVKIDAFRRALQQSYIDLFKNKVNPPPPPTGLPAGFVITPPSKDVRSLARAELRALDAQVTAATGKAGNAETRAHLQDVHNSIDHILNPKN
ncbi:MAG: zinc-dependent metalloprotease [Gemmatimonadota bacterium]